MISWQPPTDPMVFGLDDVHVWRVYLDRNMPYVHRMREILSADEKSRADRFYFEKDRDHFIMARGMLRVILSGYLDQEPSKLRFNYNPFGKPTLAGTSGEEMLSFNVSHSDGLSLYAVTRGRMIGIDIERIRRDFSCEQIAKQYFSPLENVMLFALPKGHVREKAFFSCWTRKEAYIKAKGEGLSHPLDKFEVSLGPGKPAKLIKHYEFPQEVNRWLLKEIHPAQGYVASLAVEGQNWHLTCYDAIHG
jgi:4'-phosphopantetheinyl transferase